MFIKKTLNCKLRNDLSLSAREDIKIENLWFEIEKNDKKFIVGGIYRHPNQNIQSFTDLLELNLIKINKGKSPCFITGDFNIDFLKADYNKNIMNYLNNLLLYNFLPVLLLPTRITRKTATLIDHIYYYEGQNKKNGSKLMSGNLYSDLSDHLPNFVLLPSTSNKFDYSSRPYIRLYTKENKQKFHDKLKSVNWTHTLYSNYDVNQCFNEFISIVKKLHDASFPLTRMSRRACKDKKWITKGLKISCNNKNNLYKKWLQTRSKIDEEKYNEYKKCFKKIAKSAEIQYYKKEFDTKVHNTKQIWNNLNKVCSAKKRKNNIFINKLSVENIEITSPSEISNAFNDYFCNIGPSLVKLLPLTSANYVEYMSPSVSQSIYCAPVTSNELVLLIHSLSSNKACGPDGVGAQLIKDNCNLFLEPLIFLFNLSLLKGVVPDSLKVAKVIPIFKKGDVHLPSNYRPISLLSIFNKLLEKIVYKRLYSFLDKNQILYKNQFGFRKKHSTAMALLEVIDLCYQNFDINNKVLGIYFDLQKAFDTVDHNILLHKLYNYGIRGVLYEWLKNYLTNRKQYTVVNNTSSKIGNIVCGVPQGSVLGPLLFLIYINDISNAVGGELVKLFADDTNLFMFGSNLSVLESQANVVLKKMELWFIANKLSLNADKTCYTLFSRQKSQDLNSQYLKLYINNQLISKVSSCKYLGVIIDETLEWKEHIDHVWKKLIKFTSIFYKVRNVLPFACLRKLYFAFIHPHLLYGVEVYANTAKCYLDKLVKLNNKLLRILLKKKMETPIINLYQTFNVLPLPLLHEMQMLLFVHKCYYKLDMPLIFRQYFLENNIVHGHNTRNNCDLHIQIVHSNVGQRCSLFCGSKLWNALPRSLKTIQFPFKFKRELKNYLLSRDI